MKITIQVIPHRKQRYNTVGDWLFDKNGDLNINVSKMNADYSFLIVIHELIEAYLCRSSGVDQSHVDQFDMEYQGDDPGADKMAPYHTQHVIATFIESALAAAIGVNWEQYEKDIDRISRTYE